MSILYTATYIIITLTNICSATYMIRRIIHFMRSVAVELGKKVHVEQLECLRCSHKWFPRISQEGEVDKPKTCPKCRSPYWNKPVQRKFVSENRKKK